MQPFRFPIFLMLQHCRVIVENSVFTSFFDGDIKSMPVDLSEKFRVPPARRAACEFGTPNTAANTLFSTNILCLREQNIQFFQYKYNFFKT